MLHINHIIIKNFGPYLGENKITFEDKGICIIWGKNGYGKTSILNSFRYALWGKIYNRKREPQPPCNFVNTIAIDRREDMSITVSISYDGENYILTRGLKRVSGDGSHMEDYEKIYHIKNSKSVLSPQERDHFLATALPEKISRFYLFDGELLSEYEDLLEDESSAGAIIKESIEAILGLPILESASRHIQAITKNYIAEADKASKNDEKTKELSSTLKDLREKLEHLQEEQNRLRKKLSEYQNQKHELEERLANSTKFRDKISLRDSIIKEINDKRKDLESYIEEISPVMSEAWRSVLIPVLKKLIEKNQSIIDQIEEKNKHIILTQNIKVFLEESLAKDAAQCPVCKTHLNDAIRQNILNTISSFASSIISSEDKDASYTACKNKDFCEKQIVDSKKDIAILILKNIIQTNDSISFKTVKLDNIKEEIAKIQSEETEETARSLINECTKCGKNIEITEEGLRDQAKKIAETEADISQLESKIAKLSTSKPFIEANAKADLCKKIGATFIDGITSFRDKLKEDVQSDATILFTSISHDHEYQSLSINDNYGLEIVHKDGRTVPNRSSGYEQVVAISLIGALHKNAPISGPVFMDSTFQRIDSEHKDNVISVLPSLGEQVIILATDGELDQEHAKTLLGDSLTKEVRLDHKSSFETHIIE